MKKILALLLISATFSVAVNAQLRTNSNIAPVQRGSSVTLGSLPYTVYGIDTADTLAVSDTIAYVIPFTGSYQYIPFVSFGWTKIGSGTATVTASFYQGNTPYNFVSVKAGSANSVYTKTFTLSASGTNFIDFLADSAKVSGRYLKVQFMTSSTASVSGSVNTVVSSAMK